MDDKEKEIRIIKKKNKENEQKRGTRMAKKKNNDK